MRGTENKDAYGFWRQGQKHLPIATQADFDESLRLANAAHDADKNYPRGLSRLSYIYVTGVIEDWKFSGDLADWSDEDILQKAEEHAERAVKLDGSDYDTHWALAFVYLYTDRGDEATGDEAVDEYETALSLNDNNMNLLAEMADSLVYLGRPDDAIAKIKRARRLWDWHRWVLAWAYYFKGKEDEIFYDMALDELRQMYLGPHDDRYPLDILILMAALHAQKAETQEGETQKREMSKATAVRDLFLEKRPGWTRAKWKKTGAFKNPDDQKHWLDGLDRAGLP